MDESQKKWGNKLDAERDEELGGELDHDLEAELRAGLRSLPAPEGFADRVLSRALAGSRAAGYQDQPVVPQKMVRPARPFSIPQPALRSGIAAVLLALTVGGYFGYQRQQRIAGEHARQQVLLALRITGSTLQTIRNQVDNEHPNNNTY